jgi:uncharacterized protein (TIGR01244 family)
MADFRQVTDEVSVAPQISVDDVQEAARLGFRTIVNNRPDGEDPSQPSGQEIEAAARAAGLAYHHLPVRGGPTPEQVAATEQLMAQAEKPVLAFCRSGTRSIVTWALAEAAADARSPPELVEIGRRAGYDLAGLFPR